MILFKDSSAVLSGGANEEGPGYQSASR